MYKDKYKQMEANRRASQRYRDKRKGMTDTGSRIIPSPGASVIPKQGITVTGMTITEEPTPLPRDCSHLNVDLNPKAQSHNPMMIGYVPPRTA